MAFIYKRDREGLNPNFQMQHRCLGGSVGKVLVR